MPTPRLSFAALCAVACLFDRPASAQPEPQSTLRARALGEDALALYDRGEFAAALDKLEAADRLVAAPSLRLYAARCLARLGRLREAAERYRALAATSVPANASEAFRRAPSEAAAELAALEPTIPRIRISVDGSIDALSAAQLDGRTLTAIELAGEILLDPGKHELVAERDGVERRVVFEIAAGQRRELKLRFSEKADAPVALGSSAPERAADGSTQRTVGFVAIGVGLAGLGLGAALGIVAAGEESDLVEACGEDRVCPRDRQADVDAYDRLRAGSTIGLIAGSLAAAAGVTLVLVAPRPATARGARRGEAAETAVWVGAGSVGLRRRF
jgi:hypothetical protein